MAYIKVKELVGNTVIIGCDNICKIEPEISRAQNTSVILDFDGIESISSPFAHSLLKCLNTHDSVTIKNASPHVLRMIGVVRSRTRASTPRKTKNLGRVVIKTSRPASTHLERYINAAR
jgi:hypothetical protein